MTAPSFIDLFCGAGGSTLGAELAGLVPIAAVNHWTVAADTYEVNHGLRPVRSAMAAVDPATLPRPDVLLASPECTNHSRARGKKKVDEQSRNTAREVYRFVRALRPRVFVVENVPEFQQWSKFHGWCQRLAQLGYHLNSHDRPGQLLLDGMSHPGQILNSADFGVPQARIRWFLVGHQERPVTLRSPMRPRRNVRECIDWNYQWARNHREKPLCEKSMRRIRMGEAVYGDDPFLAVHYKSGPQFMGIDRPCRTVPTNDRFRLCQAGWSRFLEPDELKLIQGFPPSYRLLGTQKDQLKLIGNAVPAAVMSEILRQAA